MKIAFFVALVGVLGAGAEPCVAGQPRFATLSTISGGNPVGLVAAGGVLYGTTSAVTQTGGNCGTVFELQPPTAPGAAWVETVLYAFTGVNGDGCLPVGALAVGTGDA